MRWLSVVHHLPAICGLLAATVAAVWTAEELDLSPVVTRGICLSPF